MKNNIITPRLFQLKTPSGVKFDDTAAFELTAGVYHRFEIQTNLKNKKTVKKVTVDIGGTPVTISTGQQLDLIQRFKGKNGKPGRIILDLSKFEYKSPRGIYKTGLAIGHGDNATLNVEFGDRDTSDSNSQNHDPESITMKGKAWMTENPAASITGSGRMNVPMRKTITLNSAAAGSHEWSFPGAQGVYLQRLMFDESEVGIKQIIVKRGKTEIAKIDRADIDFMLEDIADMAPQAGHLLLDFTLLGFGENDAIHTPGLNFEFEVDKNGPMKTYIEGWEPA